MDAVNSLTNFDIKGIRANFGIRGRMAPAVSVDVVVEAVIVLLTGAVGSYENTRRLLSSECKYYDLYYDLYFYFCVCIYIQFKYMYIDIHSYYGL